MKQNLNEEISRIKLMMGKIMTESFEDVKEQEKTPSNLVSCSGLGVKSPGLCDKKTKKPVVSCAKLGVKSIGYCFVDTKQPVPMNEQDDMETPQDGEVNEVNPFLRFAKNLISPDVKVLRQGMELRNIKSPAVKSLIQKFGTVSMTNFVKGTLRPFEDSMAIFVNDYKKLQNLKVPTGDKHDYVAYLNQQINDVRREIAVPVGKPINLDYLYHKTDMLTTYVDNIIKTKQVNRQGIKILTDMKQTVNNALHGIEDALGQIATRK